MNKWGCFLDYDLFDNEDDSITDDIWAKVIISFICLVCANTAIMTNDLVTIETFPTKCRGTALAICQTFGKVCIVIAEVTNIMEIDVSLFINFR